MIHVICIEPKLMHLWRCTKELRPQPSVSRGRDTNWGQLGNYLYITIMFGGFLQCETWWNIAGHLFICQTPSPLGTSRTSTSSSIWSAIGSSMFTLELLIVWLTQVWEKFKQLCLCESPFDVGARFTFHL